MDEMNTCKKEIICLANSRKPPSGGRCIAGKELTKGRWIRPVSNRDTHEISDIERSYTNSEKAGILDIISILLKYNSPNGHQVENYIIEDNSHWEKTGTASWEQVLAAVDNYDSDFWSNSESTYHGLNDKIDDKHLCEINCSLKLISVSDLVIQVKEESVYDSDLYRLRVRARFTYGNKDYCLSISDPEIEDQYSKKRLGDYEIGEAALCISLPRWDNGFAYRIVASVITKDRILKR